MPDKPSRLSLAMAAVDAELGNVESQTEQLAPVPDPKYHLVLTFRHGAPDREAAMVSLIMPDMTIANIMLDYFARWHVPAKLIQPTAHQDIQRVLREV